VIITVRESAKHFSTFQKEMSVFIVYKPNDCTADQGGMHEEDTIRGIYYSLDDAKYKGQALLNQETFDWWIMYNYFLHSADWERYNRLPSWEIIEVPLEKQVSCEFGENVVAFITVSTSGLEQHARYNEYKLQFDDHFDRHKRYQLAIALDNAHRVAQSNDEKCAFL
jgi:hypothetical protein